MERFLRRHPSVRDALFWGIPAVLFGLVLRALLLSYSPYAYWGADSESYMGFAWSLLDRGSFDLNEKRRYTYPLFLLPPSLLPGAALRWIAWMQHGFGLGTVFAFAWIVRKTFARWRLWIVPLTVLFAGMPMFLWYEHEVLAETLFFAFVVWTLAGWIAWSGARPGPRAERLWWLFFAPLALLVLTKPSARFFWPGLFLALAAVRAWRGMTRRQGAALAALFAATFTLGQEKQGAWLLYNSSFPLTRLDTPLHADYKAEIADLVRPARASIATYYREDASSGIKRFLKAPDRQEERPLWAALPRDKKKQAQLYRDLAIEGIRSRPDLFLGIALLRIVDSSNPADFRDRRFAPDYFAQRLDESYPNIVRKEGLMARLFGLPEDGDDPPLETVKAWTAPNPDAPAARALGAYVEGFNNHVVLSQRPGKHSDAQGFRLTPLGWLAAAGLLLAAAVPRYRNPLGLWLLVIGGYLFGVFLVGSGNARFFGPAWPLLLLLLAVLPDYALGRAAPSGRKSCT